MALQIMKLVVNVDTTVITQPTVTRFFHTLDADQDEGTLEIDTADFFDDIGEEVTELPELATDNSYYNVYINGVLQMDGITSYEPGPTTEGGLEITVDEEEVISEGTPVVLEIVNFESESDTTVTT